MNIILLVPTQILCFFYSEFSFLQAIVGASGPNLYLLFMKHLRVIKVIRLEWTTPVLFFVGLVFLGSANSILK